MSQQVYLPQRFMHIGIENIALALPCISLDLFAEIETHLLIARRCMQFDDPFPLNAIKPQVRDAILSEFKGRLPSYRDIAEISDKVWLTVPGMGLKALEQIRNLTAEQVEEAAGPTVGQLSDAELLRRVEQFQEEVRVLADELRARLVMVSKQNSRQWSS